ncbi:MAG: hypothetical protein OXE17_00140 [Chloroflexi bacterium]|nr:hypothetical protein [Chloroflexota bacterium]
MTTSQVTIELGDPREQRFEELEVPAGIRGSGSVGDMLRTGRLL